MHTHETVYINASRTFLQRGSAVRELAVAAAHLHAIHLAYDAGDDVALVFEDDASAALVPFWRNCGLKEVEPTRTYLHFACTQK